MNQEDIEPYTFTKEEFFLLSFSHPSLIEYFQQQDPQLTPVEEVNMSFFNNNQLKGLGATLASLIVA